MTTVTSETTTRPVANASDSDLVEQIMSLDLTSGDLADFEPRLRRENGWSASFARRAIGEYRKFLVLAATARHPVSPSDVVDQVWHLHLLYTRSYWNDLCANILPRPLHHAPSTGAASESEKFADWYMKTRASYRRVFGEDPPRDIWPAPAPAPVPAMATAGTRSAKSPRRRYVDLDANWIVPRVSRGVRVAVIALLLALLLLLAGCDAGSGGGGSGMRASESFNPFDLPGPAFLLLFIATFIVACTIAYNVRAKARVATDASERAPLAPIDLDPYEIAYLNGGPILATNAAITRLVDRGEIEVTAHGTLRRFANAAVTIDGHPLERGLFAAVGTRWTPVRDVRARVESSLATIRRQLDDSGYLVDPDRAAAARRIALLVALSVPAAGVIKLLVGLERGRPVGILAFLILAFTGIAIAIFIRRIHRSERGDVVLEHLKEKHARVRMQPAATTAAVNGGAYPFAGAQAGVVGGDPVLSLGVALFGLSWLAGSEHEQLRKALKPKDGSADGWSAHSSCGAGGGASCGGGGESSCGTSSCGGGGGGGGGCGGCGGGGCGGS